jgi:hypothetical protein
MICPAIGVRSCDGSSAADGGQFIEVGHSECLHQRVVGPFAQVPSHVMVMERLWLNLNLLLLRLRVSF